MNNIFVYGTLMKGFENHKNYLSDYIIEERNGWLRGKLYHLPYGYPAVIEGEGIVHGEIYVVRDIKQLLLRLDWLEDYNQHGSEDMYIRTIRRVTDVFNNLRMCYVYLWSPKRLDELLKNGIYIDNGNWKSFITNFKK